MNLRYPDNDARQERTTATSNATLILKIAKRLGHVRLIAYWNTRLLEIFEGERAVVRGNMHFAKSVKQSFPRNEKDLLPVDHSFCVRSRAHAEPISHMETMWNHFIYICGLSMRETEEERRLHTLLKHILIGFFRSTFPRLGEPIVRASARSILSTRSPSTRPERLDNPPSTDATSERILTIV
jgi:hypothetical protein